MKFQTIACAVAIATGGLFFTHVVNDAIAANSNEVVSKAVFNPLKSRHWYPVSWQLWLIVSII